MNLFFADLVREVSHGIGAGDLALEGALPGHRRFADVVPPGARFHYAIAGITDPGQWETGEGALGSGDTLLRTPLASSAGGAAVAFSEGLKTVALTVGAAWFAARDAALGIDAVEGLEAALAGKAGQAEVDGLEAALVGKAGQAEVDALEAALAGKAGQAEVDALEAALAGKAALAGAAFAGPVSAPSLTLGSDLAIADGGTGASSAAAARANLGLGSIALQDAAAIAVTGGSIAGLASLGVAGDADVGGDYRVDGVKVVSNRRTGWTAPTGTASRATFDTSGATAGLLAQRLKALIDDLIAHGLIGS
jgi:hypothetical protein